MARDDNGEPYTRQGALKRFKRLNRLVDGRLLHRDGPGAPWLVSLVVLSEINKIHERERVIDESVEEIGGRVSDVEVRLLALRNSHNANKRRVMKRLDLHEKALAILRSGNRALEDLFGEKLEP
jgi:hypothetical protein